MLRLHLFGVGIRQLADKMLLISPFPPGFGDLRSDGPRRAPNLICQGKHFLFWKRFREIENRPRNLTRFLIYPQVLEAFGVARRHIRVAHSWPLITDHGLLVTDHQLHPRPHAAARSLTTADSTPFTSVTRRSSLFAGGNVKRNVAPPPSLFSAHSRPP